MYAFSHPSHVHLYFFSAAAGVADLDRAFVARLASGGLADSAPGLAMSFGAKGALEGPLPGVSKKSAELERAGLVLTASMINDQYRQVAHLERDDEGST